YFEPYPIFIKHALGSKIWDVDGNQYTDFNMGFGPSILGHSDPDVLEHIRSRMDGGLIFGAPTEDEIELADLIAEADPSMEMMRFSNSGTEATMHAIRLARGYTSRKVVVKMEGGFHGSHDYALIKSGSGSLTFGIPSSAGVPEEAGRTVAVASYNNLESVKKVFDRHGKDIACVITEPVFGNTGVILPEAGFLEGLRDLCDRNGSLLIFDEVITGFRFGFSTYQRMIGVHADLTVLGKIVGGGLPIGVFGGRSEIMRKVAPSGNVYVSGTFSGNPIAMSSGVATLRKLKKMDYRNLSEKLGLLLKNISGAFRENGVKAAVNGTGSMFQFFIGVEDVKNYEDAMRADSRAYMNIFRSMIRDGEYLAPGQYETNFLSFAHSNRDLDGMVAKLKSNLAKIIPR
ncbi:MAG: glutamate-1-semialdehyde 2,1-aminomutase, partial [Thermoplasmataceae archaeon]